MLFFYFLSLFSRILSFSFDFNSLPSLFCSSNYFKTQKQTNNQKNEQQLKSHEPNAGVEFKLSYLGRVLPIELAIMKLSVSS